MTSCDDRTVVFHQGRVLSRPERGEAALEITRSALEALGLRFDRSIPVDVNNAPHLFVQEVEDESLAAQLEEHFSARFQDFRRLPNRLDERIWDRISRARALLEWHRAYGYCPRCGSPTLARSNGGERDCTNPECGTLHFPRTDAAIIVRVVHDDRCLLARQPRFQPGVRSVLAGFLEPGETLEGAVRREVMEEVGLTLTTIDYFGSQPWPFPMNLMVGFTAVAKSPRLCLDGEEIEAADWYTREQVHDDLASGALVLPSTNSISRRLIESWLQDL